MGRHRAPEITHRRGWLVALCVPALVGVVLALTPSQTADTTSRLPLSAPKISATEKPTQPVIRVAEILVPTESPTRVPVSTVESPTPTTESPTPTTESPTPTTEVLTPTTTTTQAPTTTTETRTPMTEGVSCAPQEEA